MEKVYIVLYNDGTYKELVEAYKNEEDARNKIKQLEDENYMFHVYYTYETFNVL